MAAGAVPTAGTWEGLGRVGPGGGAGAWVAGDRGTPGTGKPGGCEQAWRRSRSIVPVSGPRHHLPNSPQLGRCGCGAAGGGLESERLAQAPWWRPLRARSATHTPFTHSASASVRRTPEKRMDPGPFPPGVATRNPLARKCANFTWSYVS